jgi:putative membrane protein
MMGWNWEQMMTWHMGWGNGGMWLGGAGMLLFWVAIVVLAVWGLRALATGSARTQPPAGPPPTPLEIAQARYARGEIGRDEYETIRLTLQERA